MSFTFSIFTVFMIGFPLPRQLCPTNSDISNTSLHTFQAKFSRVVDLCLTGCQNLSNGSFGKVAKVAEGCSKGAGMATDVE